jgi:exopolyphosphatase/guanosine-5'-triphosphate,3'-diphosphate pyrophosphatase
VKLAAFDIGTNTVLMVAVESQSSGQFKTLLERSRITRLGKNIDRTGKLDTESSRVTFEAILEFANDARAAGVERIVAVATSALRDAADGAEFIRRVKERGGVELKVISGIEEAELSSLAVKRSLDISPDVRLLITDIGGGSTELISSEPGRALETVSLQIGSVRLTERLIHTDPPSVEEKDTLRSVVDDELAKLGWSFRPDVLVGIAGTVTTIAAVALGMRVYDAARVHGYVLMRDEVAGVVRKFGELNLEERKKLPGLLEARADVIFAGSVILERVMRRFEVGHVIVSDQGVRWGLIWRELDPIRPNQTASS